MDRTRQPYATTQDPTKATPAAAKSVAANRATSPATAAVAAAATTPATAAARTPGLGNATPLDATARKKLHESLSVTPGGGTAAGKQGASGNRAFHFAHVFITDKLRT
jgi:hypothetical protein